MEEVMLSKFLLTIENTLLRHKLLMAIGKHHKGHRLSTVRKRNEWESILNTINA